jgi:hypothetical protein
MGFKHTESPIEFEATWIKSKDAAGTVVLWILAFLAMVGGSRMFLIFKLRRCPSEVGA